MLVLVLLFIIIFFLIENRRQIASLSKEASQIKRALYEDEMSINLLKFKDIDIFSDEEYEEKIRIYNQIRGLENHQANQRILLGLLEKGIITEEEYQSKSQELEYLFEAETWNNSDELLELIRKTGLTNIKYFVEKRENSWVCICGAENDLIDNNYFECKLNQQFVLENCVRPIQS